MTLFKDTSAFTDAPEVQAHKAEMHITAPSSVRNSQEKDKLIEEIKELVRQELDDRMADDGA